MQEDYALNRKVTLLYGITFFFVFLSAIVSEVMSLVLDEGLLTPFQVVFHTLAFIGYIWTFYYVYKSQEHIEEKNSDIVKNNIQEDEELLKGKN